MSEDYFLGVSQDELQRLQRQHIAWQPETIELIKRAELHKAANILDLGCGPGFTSIELSQSCPESTIYALDKSELYHNYLKEKIQSDKLDKITPIQKDIISDTESEELYDGAFCRWFLAFLIQDLKKVLSNIYSKLKPGASFALMEYLTLESFTPSPPSTSFDAYKRAWINFYLAHGGDSNIGSYLPSVLEEVGFTVTSQHCVGGQSAPDHRWYRWWRDAFDHFSPRFVEEKLMSESDRKDLDKYFREQENNKNSFLYSAVILQIVAVK